MKKYNLPWGQWYEQSVRTISFPDDWEVVFRGLKNYPQISEEAIENKIDKPIGTEKLEILAKGKKKACIIIDDISRPTPGAILLPVVIKKLIKAGMTFEDIKVLIALGGHRPMTKQEMEIKVGKWVLEHVQVLNHSPFAADLVSVQDDEQTIKINKNFVDADLRLAVGCIVPHTLAGFSGGAKAVIPGVCGIDTLYSNHTLVFSDVNKNKSFRTSTCDPNNAMRRNMEKLVGKVGLDFIVNVVLNDEMQIADLYSGHFIKAHRSACKRATEILKTELVPNADINILSAYPKDTEYSQIGTCFAVLGNEKENCVAKDGTIVAMTAASEGAGFHSLFGPGMRLFSPHNDNIPPVELKGTEVLIYSDGVTTVDIQQFWVGKAPTVYSEWDAVLKKLIKKYDGKKPKVAIYPMGALQIGYLPTGEE